MPKYVIERELPNAGQLSPQQLQAAARNSSSVLETLGPQIQWVETFVTDDKLFCVYISPDEQTIRQHAQQAGLPANRICRVTAIIDPTTAESPAPRRKPTGRLRGL
jgi:hypothetical protein